MMDLGNILGDLLTQAGSAAIAREFAPDRNNPLIPDLIEYGLAGPKVEGRLNADGSITDAKLCKRRRRRKRLATVSDIRDLAALKNILGNGEAFKTWIATHSR